MTEKRFTYHTDGCLMEWITDSKDGERVSPKCATEWLNTLYEENDVLKSNIDIRDKSIIELKEENEQLKSEYKLLHIQYRDLQKFVENNFDEYLTQEKLNRQIIKLSDENEQLKQQLADIDRLIYDLGHDEMRRQYEEIFKGDVE